MRHIGAFRHIPNVAALGGGFYDDFSGSAPRSEWSTLLGTLATNSGALRASALASDGYEMAINPGFETYTGTQDDGVSDSFTSWTANGVNDGAGDKIEATSVATSGSNAIKMTRTTSVMNITQDVACIPGANYTVGFQTRGNGVRDGRYSIYDVTNLAYIVSSTSTGVTGEVYTSISVSYAAPAGCISSRLYLIDPSAAGVCYFDDVSLQLYLSALTYNPRTPNAVVTASMVSPASAVTPRALYLRGTDALNYVCLRLLPNTAGTDTILETVTAGVRATVASGTADVDWTAGGTDRVRVTCQGNDYTVEHMKSGASTWTTAFTATSASFNTATLFGPMVWATADNSWADIQIQGA